MAYRGLTTCAAESVSHDEVRHFRVCVNNVFLKEVLPYAQAAPEKESP